MNLPGSEGPWIERLVASRRVRSAYVSLLAHVGGLLLLTLLATPQKPPRLQPIKLAMPAAADDPAGQEAGQAAKLDLDPLPAGGQAELDAGEPRPGPAAADLLAAVEPPPAQPPIEPLAPLLEGVAAEPANEPHAAVAAADLAAPLPLGTRGAAAGPQAAAAAVPASMTAGRAFAGRQGEARSRGVAARGGSAASEAAVERGLEWLALHQAPDGSWRFDLSGCRCDGGCRNPGSVTSTTAATGIALLPFLGAGHTHTAGSHRETVTRGLYYLMSRLKPTPRGGDLGEGTMYGQGVATLALAEALGMTGDPMLATYVRDAIRFIETAQDMHGGGWRYLPGQAGDTTVTAWQLAALKSAALAGVAVPSPTIDAACRFLDRVQVRQGEGYGYLGPQDRSCTSAIGLVCRIYTAWPEEATLDRGLARLARPGPPPEAVYQNFYLAQALLLRNHPAWGRWNARNRDQLVARQARFGHEAGSWTFADSDTAPGGRLGHTALAILTLEVYYRLLPIFGEQAAESGW
jgi:hypothetical protein